MARKHGTFLLPVREAEAPLDSTSHWTRTLVLVSLQVKDRMFSPTP